MMQSCTAWIDNPHTGHIYLHPRKQCLNFYNFSFVHRRRVYIYNVRSVNGLLIKLNGFSVFFHKYLAPHPKAKEL